MKRIIKTVTVFGLVAALAVPVCASELEGEIEAANTRQEELQQEVANSQARLEELQGSKADIEQRIAEIDAEIAQVDSLITQYSNEALDKEGQIKDLEVQIGDQEDELQNKYDKMKIRIKYMYENLDANYIEAIFSSVSFGEFFEKVEYIAALNSYDRKMMDEIELLSKELKANKSTVEEELEVVQALGDAQEEQKVVLDDLQVMKSAELSNTEVAIQAEVEELGALNAMLEENAGYIAELSAEFDAMMAAGGQPDPEAEAAAQEAEAEAAKRAEEAAAAQAEAERLAAEAEAARQAAEQATAAPEETSAEPETNEAGEPIETEAPTEAPTLSPEEQAAAQAEADRLAEEAAAAQEAAAAAAAEQEAAQAQATAKRDEANATVTGEAGVATGSWIWPVPGYNTISSGFGDRDGGFHAGIDIPAPEGTPVVAVDGGKVVMARWSAGADTGNYTVIYHGNGVYSEYMHQSDIYVSEGDVVAQGQAIGAVGNTGNSYGAHLHLSEGIGAQYWLNRVAPPF